MKDSSRERKKKKKLGKYGLKSWKSVLFVIVVIMMRKINRQIFIGLKRNDDESCRNFRAKINAITGYKRDEFRLD